MIDGLESRMWIENHARFSEEVGGFLARCRHRGRRADADPLPVIGRALALALAASLASLGSLPLGDLLA